MKVLGISGSLRRGSHNTALLRAAAELLPDGSELELWDGLRAVPPYDEDDDIEPAQAELRKVLAATGARVVEGEVAVGHAHNRFDEDGWLIDDDLRDQLADVVAALVTVTRARELLAA